FKQLVVIREACERTLAAPPAAQSTNSDTSEHAPTPHIKDGAVPGPTAKSITATGETKDAPFTVSREQLPKPKIPSQTIPKTERTVSPGAPPKPSPQPPSPPPSMSTDHPDTLSVLPVNGPQPVPALGIDQCLERIAEQLLRKKGLGPSQLMLGDTKLVLATW